MGLVHAICAHLDTLYREAYSRYHAAFTRQVTAEHLWQEELARCPHGSGRFPRHEVRYERFQAERAQTIAMAQLQAIQQTRADIAQLTQQYAGAATPPAASVATPDGGFWS